MYNIYTKEFLEKMMWNDKKISERRDRLSDIWVEFKRGLILPLCWIGIHKDKNYNKKFKHCERCYRYKKVK